MILISRPAPHLPRTLAVLEGAGFTGLFPLALSKPQTLPAKIPTNASALIFTSPFGIQQDLPNLPAYCVGKTTATAARKAGYTVAYTGTGNGVTMARDIAAQNLPPHHFAHLHGDHAGMAWHTLLNLAGHTVTPVLAYKTRRIEKLPPGIVTSLLIPDSSLLIPLFSAGSATHLANLLKRVNIRPSGTAICFSPAVARAAARHWPHVATADEPTLAAMVATIRRFAG